MGNLLGVLHTGEPGIPLDRALAALRFPADKAAISQTTSSDGRLSIHIASLGIYRSQTYGTSPLIFLLGKIFNLEDFIQPNGEHPPEIQKVRLLTRALRDDAVLSSFKGDFLLGGYFPEEQTLIIANDRWGLRNLYYAQVQSAFVFSTRLDVLAMVPGIKAELHPPALADYLFFQYVLGEKTLLSDVRQMNAAGKIRVKEGVVHSSIYWKPSPLIETGIQAREAVEKVWTQLRASVDRFLVPEWRPVLALTGGFDSRVLLTAIVASGKKIQTYGMAGEDDPDAPVATRLARMAGLPEHHIWPITLEGTLPNIPDAVRLLGGDIATLHSDTLSMLRKSPDAHHLMLTGYGGELWRTYLRGHGTEADQDWFAYCRAMCQHFKVQIGGFDLFGQQGPFTDRLWSQIRNAPHYSMDEALRGYRVNYSPEVRADIFYLTQRCRKYLMKGPKLAREFQEVGFPYMDEDLVSTVLSLPDRVKRGAYLGRTIVVANAPQLSWVVHERYGLPLRWCTAWVQDHSYIFFRLNSLLRRKRGVTINGLYSRWLREDLFPLAERTLLSERALSRGIFEAARLRELLQHSRRKTKRPDLRVEIALALEMWCQQVLDRM